MKEIKPEVQSVIENWYKNVEYDVIQVWEQDDTWFLAIRHYTKGIRKSHEIYWPELDFVRIFPSYRIKGDYHLSVDNTVSV